MQARLHGVEGAFAYSIPLCAGIITWRLFAEIIQRSPSAFLDNATLLKKLIPELENTALANEGVMYYGIINSLVNH